MQKGPPRKKLSWKATALAIANASPKPPASSEPARASVLPRKPSASTASVTAWSNSPPGPSRSSPAPRWHPPTPDTTLGHATAPASLVGAAHLWGDRCTPGPHGPPSAAPPALDCRPACPAWPHRWRAAAETHRADSQKDGGPRDSECGDRGQPRRKYASESFSDVE
ncbi:infB, partial [Ophiophagus hannah]